MWTETFLAIALVMCQPAGLLYSLSAEYLLECLSKLNLQINEKSTPKIINIKQQWGFIQT